MALVLRKICYNDLEMIMKWRMSSEVTKYMYTDPKLTIEGQKKWFKSILYSDTQIYWIIQIDGNDIGVININSIDYKNRRCSWAYYIADTSFRGRGIATQLECNIYDFVFNILNLNKICCEVFCTNEKVIAIHQKFGAEIEGTRREQICKNGQFYDIVEMGINQQKWELIKDKFTYEKIKIESYSEDKNSDSKYAVGQSASFSKTITESDVILFAGITGDFNSVHINEQEASKSIFKKRICHGMLVASFISTVLGNYLPGDGTIYLSQTIEFLKPTYIGDTVTAVVEVKKIIQNKILILDTYVTNQNGTKLITGEATVKIPIKESDK